MKDFSQMWDELSKYLSCDRGLDQGYADGKYTKIFAKYCKHIEGIDLSEDFFNKAKINLEGYDNVHLQVMDAKNTPFPDKSFDVILNTSFHEFDLSGDVFEMDPDLKTEILQETMRLSDTIIFAEPDVENVTNDLFRVFNPAENHALRIAKSNELIDKVLKENGYQLLLEDRAVDNICFDSREAFIEEMLAWWEDVKVPKDEDEKKEMLKQITEILEKANLLADLCLPDIFRFVVYKKI